VTHTNLLKFLNRERGYSFIKSDTGGPDHFLHFSDVQRSRLNPDQLEDGKTRLSYSLEEDTKKNKSKAVNISILD
jgi:cold shock protein